MNKKLGQNQITMHLWDQKSHTSLADHSRSIGLVIVDEEGRSCPNGFRQTLSLEACGAELTFEQTDKLNNAAHELHLVIMVVFGTNTDAAVCVAKILKKNKVQVVAVVMQQVASTLQSHCHSVIVNLTPGGFSIKNVLRGAFYPAFSGGPATIDYEDFLQILSRTQRCVLGIGSARTASEATLRAISWIGDACLRQAEVALVALSAPRATPLKLQDLKTVLNFVKDIQSQQENSITFHSVTTNDEASQDEVSVALLVSCVLTVDADVPLTTAMNE